MAWNLKGHYYDSCSCKMSCRCALGPAEPDQGWCSGLQLVEVDSGQSNGLDLGGTRFALALQLPGDFFGGVEKARLYFDEARTTTFGIMNVPAMIALAAVIAVEKIWRWGEYFSRVVGVAALAAALAVVWQPGLAPGLTNEPMHEQSTTTGDEMPGEEMSMGEEMSDGE